MPDSQAGHLSNVDLRLLPDSSNEHDDATHQGQTSKYRGNRNSVMIFLGDMHWSYIHYFFAMGVSESLISKRKAAQNDEKNSTPNIRFHMVVDGGYTDRLRP